MEYKQLTIEKPSDISAFYTHVFSDSEGPNEGLLIGELVNNMLNECNQPELIGFVAIENNTLFGAVLFSKLSFSKGEAINAFILSPMAVATSQQGKGIGQALIKFALSQLQHVNVDFIVTYGDPNYYNRVGFKPLSDSQLIPPCKLSFPHGWQALSLCEKALDQLSGTISCVPPLNNPEYW